MSISAGPGIDLSRAYCIEVVAPLIAARLPRLRFTAGRLGAGSDVLGFDDEISRDHDWGLRLSVLTPHDAIGPVQAALAAELPESFRGHPTRFAFTGETEEHHHVEVDSTAGFLDAHLGFDPRAGISAGDWLSLSGQAVLEVTAGPIFIDRLGELVSARRLLEWYPDDIWRYVLASGWDRIGQELPLMRRAADVGDDMGSRIIAARLSQIVLHLAFMIERRWPPYAKWFGTAFQRLPGAGDVRTAIDAALCGTNATARERGLADALQLLLERQNALGLTALPAAMIPFWDRPSLHPDPAIATQLLGGAVDPEIRLLPRGCGAVEQRTDNVDILMSPRARREAIL